MTALYSLDKARHLPRDVDWYADPSGANEIAELRCAGFTVNKGVNALAIAAISAHSLATAFLTQNSKLKTPASGRRRAEIPDDENNHALGDAAT